MPRNPTTVLLPLCCVLPLTACGGQHLLPELLVERMEVPASLLSCRPPPPPRPVDTQRDVALLIVDLAEAGEDCRGKLRAVKEVVEGR